jgi:hypothetical protein
MTIVGDVFYYVITHNEAEAIEKKEGCSLKGQDSLQGVAKSTSIKDSFRYFADANEKGIKRRVRTRSTDSITSVGTPTISKAAGLRLLNLKQKPRQTIHFVIDPDLYEKDENGHILEKVSPTRRVSDAYNFDNESTTGKTHWDVKEGVRQRRRFSGGEENERVPLAIDTAVRHTDGGKSPLSAPALSSPTYHLRIASLYNDAEKDLQAQESFQQELDKWLEARAQQPKQGFEQVFDATLPGGKIQDPKLTTSPTMSISPSSPSKPRTITYTARFFATDDDFLMKSRIRQYFRENAYDAEDAQLFSISTATHNIVNINDLDPHPALFGMRYTVEDDPNRNQYSQWRGCISQTTFKWIAVIYIFVGFVVVKTIIPQKYAYLVSFLLAFVLCLTLILCVECDF